MTGTLSPSLLGLSWAHLGLAMLAVLAAGFLRGFTGFGFALAAVPALTLLVDPVEIVPSILLLEILAGLQLMPKIGRSVDWFALRWLVAGLLLGTPVGILALSRLPADIMRAAIGVVVLIAVLVLLRGVRLRDRPGRPVRIGVGALSGLLSGGAAMPGPPVIIFFLASPVTAAMGRASLIAFFMFASTTSALLATAAGLMTARALLLTALLAPALFAGNALGDRSFDRSSPAAYRWVAIAILIAIALLAIGRAVAGMLSGG